jgi:hypothetical protein
MLAAPEHWTAHIARRLCRRFTRLGVLPSPRRERCATARTEHAPSHAVNSS